MPKGGRKRTQEDYDREIIEASNRMRKYPEHLKSARNSKIWFEFLKGVGIYEGILESKQGQNFWDDVRDTIIKTDIGETPRWIAEQGAEIVPFKIYRNVKGQFTKQVTDKPIIIIREYESKRFTSIKKLKQQQKERGI